LFRYGQGIIHFDAHLQDHAYAGLARRPRFGASLAETDGSLRDAIDGAVERLVPTAWLTEYTGVMVSHCKRRDNLFRIAFSR
jgi:hypothetical protein